jgi:hypothetical protein
MPSDYPTVESLSAHLINVCHDISNNSYKVEESFDRINAIMRYLDIEYNHALQKMVKIVRCESCEQPVEKNNAR